METVNIKMYTAFEPGYGDVMVAHVDGLGYAVASYCVARGEWCDVNRFLPYKSWMFSGKDYFDSLENVELLWSKDVPVENDD